MTTGPASSAGEAIEKMLVEKKISSKINYEVLRDLETSQTNKPSKPQQTPIIEPVLPPKQEFVTPLVPTRRGGRKRDSSAAAPPSEAIKKPKLLHSQSPVKEELFNRVADHEVVIESGPVEYEKNDETNPVVEEDDFDELGEEDEEPISAAHLMGHLYNTGVEEEYVEYEDYE